jgi:tetratricopeptide (TPR) repeat protein
MILGLSLLLSTTLAFQAASPQSARDFRADAAATATGPAPDTVQPPPAANASITPEMRGDIFMARKMYREAVDAYKEGADKSALLANKTGIAYHQLLDLNNAKKYYERAGKLDRNYAEAINNLGAVYYAQKSYGRAISQYKKALRIKPESASYLSNLGTAYFARKNYDLAAQTYQKALEIDPTIFEARNSRTGSVIQERSIEDRAKFHYFVAKAYAKAGNVELAILNIRRALEEGFKERKKFTEEPEFAILHDNMEFQQLMTTEPKVL